MSRKFVRTEPGERIDQPDFKHLAHEGQLDAVEPLGEDLIVGQDRTRTAGEVDQPKHFVIKGFGISNPSGSLLRIEPGVAVCGYSRSGTAHYGQILSVSAATTIEVGGVPSSGSTYGVYVRLGQDEVDVENRAKWNPFAGTPVEEVQMMPTRYQDVLDATVSLTSPGPEWMQIGTVVPATMALAGTRNFFFEGREAATWLIEDQDWGHLNDRDSIRSTYGVFGFRRFVMGVSRQLQDILGTGWYGVVPISLPDIKNNRLDRRGQSATTVAEGELSGHLYPSTGDTLTLGSYARRFLSGIFNRLDIGPHDAASALLPRVTVANAAAAAGVTRTYLFDLPTYSGSIWSGTARLGNNRIRMYRTDDANGSRLEITVNAAWNEGATRWDPDENLQSCFKFYIQPNGSSTIRMLQVDAPGGPFNEATWGADVVGLFDWSTIASPFSVSGAPTLVRSLQLLRTSLSATGFHVGRGRDGATPARYGGAGTAASGTSDASAMDSTPKSMLVNDLMIHAWGFVTVSGVGPIVQLVDQVNIESITITGANTIQVVMSHGMRNNADAASAFYHVDVQPHTNSGGALSGLSGVYVTTNSDTTFTIAAGGTPFASGADTRFSFKVCGRTGIV